jgi:tRNA pseudouridine38-40 synthase
MRNIKIVLEYDGTNYSGWQTQCSGVTIQNTIEDCLERLIGHRAKVIGAGRTDSGVHALGQVASFKTDSRHETKTIRRALNALLPKDIRVIDASDVDASFHPRYSALSKRYIYYIALGGRPSVFIDRYAWALPYSLDIDLMKEAAGFFIGRKDFSSMRGSGCGAKTTIREVFDFKVETIESIGFLSFQLKGGFIKCSVEADAFLRHMVRNMVGTIIEVGRKKIPLTSIPEIIESCDRRLAGPTAPARGLFLESIKYN